MQFLRGDFTGQNTPIRPPWAVEEFIFTSICNGCGECLKHCPAQIIENGRGNYPVVNFNEGECDFCALCLDHCEPGALKRINGNQPWSIVATINTRKCLAHGNVECRSCYDPCDARAINMTPKIGGVSIPLINVDSCTGCGACFSVCPTEAITMQPWENP